MRNGRVIGRWGCLAVGVVSAVLAASSCGGGSGSPPRLRVEGADSLQLAGYMLGRDMGKMVLDMKETGVEFDNAALIIALRQALAGVPSQLSDSVLAAVDGKFKKELSAKRLEMRLKQDEESLKAANDFLEKNKAKEGVRVTPSGLQYEVLTEGAGRKPTLQDKVKVHYHGTLADGRVFDSTEGKEPVTFAVKGMIPGWVEALQLMPAGSKYKFVVPPDLGYGKRGAGPAIGPNAVLVFDIEVIEVLDAEK